MPVSMQRKSQPRQIILDELKKVTSHPTADEVFRMVRKRLPRVSLGTVYRNLELMAEQGTILKLDMGGTQRRFDGNPVNHHHVRCIECDRVADLPTTEMLDAEKYFVGMDGYELLGYRLEFQGICPECKTGMGD